MCAHNMTDNGLIMAGSRYRPVEPPTWVDIVNNQQSTTPGWTLLTIKLNGRTDDLPRCRDDSPLWLICKLQGNSTHLILADAVSLNYW